MPIQSSSSNQQRPADVVVGISEKKLSGLSLISQGQVKLWKAMLVSVFLAGLIGAFAFIAGFNKGKIAEEIGQGSEAAELTRPSDLDSFLKGDVDKDGKITIEDSLLITEYVAGRAQLTENQKYLAEVTCNGVITLADAGAISQIVMWAEQPEGNGGFNGLPLCFGDADLNGKVTEGDAKLVAEFAVGNATPTPAQLYVANVDVNVRNPQPDKPGTPTLSTYDAALIQQFVLGKIKEFPVDPYFGDVNGDLQVLTYDAALVSQHISGQRTLDAYQQKAAEVTSNSRLSEADARTISEFAVGNVDRLPIRFGDVDFDDRVTTADADLVLKLEAGISAPTPTQRYVGDVSADGTLDSFDASLIQMFVAGQIKEFPADPSRPFAVSNITIAAVSKDAATITWETTSARDLRVAYAEQSFDSLPPTTVPGVVIKQLPQGFAYEAKIKNLKPRTRYFFRVYGQDASGQVQWHDASPTHQSFFATAAELTDYTRRVAFPGGSSQYIKDGGTWVLDPTAGAGVDTLAYCRSKYPATARVEDYRYETFTGLQSPSSAGFADTVMTIRCVDETPRIAYLWGKVNQHTDKGNWMTDPDGRSGASINTLTYCKKWYPNTGKAIAYIPETIFDWKAAGNTGSYAGNVTSFKCEPQPPDFSVGISPFSLTVPQGTPNVQFSLTIVPRGGFVSEVGAWRVSGCPSGATCTVKPGSCEIKQYASCAKLIITTGGLRAGTYPWIIVTGSGAGLQRPSRAVSFTLTTPAAGSTQP